MSNNFELLSQLDLSSDLFPQTPDPPDSSLPQPRERENSTIPNQFSEAANLVQRVFLIAPDLVPHVVLFTSAQRGAGCSWVCAQTSEALADRLSGTICVLDANVRSPSMHSYFKLNNGRGLNQALLQDDSILNYVQEVHSGKLWVLTTGAVSDEQAVSWATDRLASRISELRKRFTFVLIDSPPINIYPDAGLLSSLADGAILVLEADFTRREVALRAKDSLVAANARLLGAALNKRTFPIPEFIYRRC